MQLDPDLKAIADHFGWRTQIDKFREECIEAAEAAADYQYHGNTPENIAHLIEEIADIEIMSAQIRYLFNIEQAVQQAVKQKKERTLMRIKTGFYERT